MRLHADNGWTHQNPVLFGDPEKIFMARFEKDLVKLMPALWRFSFALSGRPDSADDLSQATVLRAIERKNQFRADASLKTWVMTICRSIWLNDLRAQAVRKTGSLDSSGVEEIAEIAPTPEMNIFATEVYSKVMELPEAQRIAVELVYVQQFTYSEAAGIMDIPIGTVMSRLATARKSLSYLNNSDVAIATGKAE